MPVATLNGKGEITLPVSVRNALGLSAGTQVAFLQVDGGFLMIPVRSEASPLKGRFAGRVKKPIRVEVMREAMGAGTADLVTALPGSVVAGMRVTFAVAAGLIVLAIAIAFAGEAISHRKYCK